MKLTNKFLLNHLEYVKNTESPIIMHIWAAIASASAALGRHAWCELGVKKTYPNMYVLLVGPPGTRKNAAIDFAVDILEDVTSVRFAPDDTGGHRKGLLLAFKDDNDEIEEKNKDIFETIAKGNTTQNEINKLGKIKLSLPNYHDKHCMFAKATEFGTFLGDGSLSMLRFLIKLWDGETYRYKLGNAEYVLKRPLLGFIGGTTSMDLSVLMPPEAIGQGFMSRIILVYAAKKEKSVPPSKAKLDTRYLPYLEDTYKYLYSDVRGAITLDKEAIKLQDEIYDSNIKLADARFMHYSERRGAHLLKLAMVLACTERRTIITAEDFVQANELLIETEKFMSDALGEYGLSPLALSRQKMIEFIQHANGPVTPSALWWIMRKDMRMIDFENALADLVNGKKIIYVDTNKGKAFIYNEHIHDIEQEEFLTAEEQTEEQL